MRNLLRMTAFPKTKRKHHAIDARFGRENQGISQVSLEASDAVVGRGWVTNLVKIQAFTMLFKFRSRLHASLQVPMVQVSSA
jgi:hypothetical protein